MKTIEFPYGKEKLSYTFGDELVGVLTSSIEKYVPKKCETELVENAVWNQIESILAVCGMLARETQRVDPGANERIGS